MKLLLTLFIYLATLNISYGIQLPEIFSNIFSKKPSNSYKAIVVEHPVFNLRHRLRPVINSHNLKGADIIVFPERCINNVTTSIRMVNAFDGSPCDDKTADSIIRSVSCAARKAKVYVVINLMMHDQCSNDNPCSEGDKFVVFNTALVFDRNGIVVARYG